MTLLRASIPTSVAMESECDAEEDVTLADPAQISQVLMDLCTNASLAMGGRGAMRVMLRNIVADDRPENVVLPIPEGRCIRLSVSDTGPGIEPIVLDEIFNPYFTTKRVGEGTGLGLAVVYGIVASCEGGISVESGLGDGATFHIYFPIADEDVLEGVDGPARLPTGTERILLLDDEEGLVRAYSRALSSLGYDVVPCTIPEKALEIFRQEAARIDLVITDMTMPGMTGDRLIRKIQAIRPDTPIIVCTGHSERLAEEAVKELGIAGHALKPIVKQDIAVKIRKALDGSVGDGP